jgi:glycosyltransferase involved in cell wall biosynthesis
VRILSLFLNNEVRTGGHRRYLELVEGLAARGNEMIVLLNRDLQYEPRGFSPLKVAAPYRRSRFKRISPVFRAAVAGLDAATIERLASAELIMIHGETHLAAAALLKERTGLPIFYAHRSNTVRENLMKMSESRAGSPAYLRSLADCVWYRSYERRIARSVDMIAFQSPYDMEDFGSRVPEARGKSCVIRGNIGLPRFKEEEGKANHSASVRRLVFVGTLSPRKGLRYLLEAMDILARRGLVGLELDVLGPGDKADWKRHERFLKERGLSGRVRLHGRVDDPFPYIRDADLMVVPSLFDSYPDTTLEALHVGTPVIGSRVGGIPDQLMYDSLLFEPMSGEAIAERIGRLVDDPAEYARARELCAERRAFFRFDWAEAWEREMQAMIAAPALSSGKDVAR